MSQEPNKGTTESGPDDSDIIVNSGAPIPTKKHGDNDDQHGNKTTATADLPGLLILSRKGYIAENPVDAPLVLRVCVRGRRVTSIENAKNNYCLKGMSWTLTFGSHGVSVHSDWDKGEVVIFSVLPWIKRDFHLREHPLRHHYNSVSLIVGSTAVPFEYEQSGGMTIHYENVPI